MMGFSLLKDETFYVYMSEQEDVAVRKAAVNLCADLKKICNANAVLTDNIEDAKIIIETAGEGDAKKYPELFDSDGNLIWEAFF